MYVFLNSEQIWKYIPFLPYHAQGPYITYTVYGKINTNQCLLTALY